MIFCTNEFYLSLACLATLPISFPLRQDPKLALHTRALNRSFYALGAFIKIQTSVFHSSILVAAAFGFFSVSNILQL